MILLFAISGLLWAQSPDPDPRKTLVSAGRQERSILADLEEIDGKLGKLQKESQDLEQKKADLEARRTKNQKAVKQAGIDLDNRLTDLNKSMRILYKLHRRGLARIIFGSESPMELRRRGSYILSLIDLSTTRLDNYKNAVNEHKKALLNVKNDENALKDLATDIQKKESQLQEQRSQKKNYLQQVRSQKRTALQLIRELNQSRKELGQQLKTTSTPVVSQPNPLSNFRDYYGQLPWPVRGRIIRRFGRQIDKLTKKSVNSLGIDIEAKFGTPVRAVARGKVKLAQFIPAYGQTVALQHGKYSTVYAHLNGINVRQGQMVRQGQTVGYVGNTGLTESTDRYIVTFEIRQNRSAQNPLPWLKRR